VYNSKGSNLFQISARKMTNQWIGDITSHSDSSNLLAYSVPNTTRNWVSGALITFELSFMSLVPKPSYSREFDGVSLDIFSKNRTGAILYYEQVQSPTESR